MNVFLAILWLLLVLVALVLPIMMLIWLFKRGSATLTQTSDVFSHLQYTVDKNYNKPHMLEKQIRSYSDQQVAHACQLRQEIAERRYVKKLERLQKAQKRWQKIIP